MAKGHLVPHFLTAFGLSCGLFVIFMVNMVAPGEATLATLTMSGGILLLAALADFLDGMMARLLKVESAFGGLFDSLADAVTFGVAPAVVVLKSLSLLGPFPTMGAMVYAVCGVIRLVRFSMPRSESLAFVELEKNFVGLPIPAAATTLVATNLFFVWGNFLAPTHLGWLLVTVFLFLGYLMVSRWKFPSLKTLRLRVTTFPPIFFTVVAAILLFYGVIYYYPVLFFALSWGYILVALILSTVRLIAGRRSKILEEFDPEE